MPTGQALSAFRRGQFGCGKALRNRRLRPSLYALVGVVGRQITNVLGADNCLFVAGPIHDTRITSLDHDGVVTRGDHTVDVDRVGLPPDEYVALLVRRGPRVIGHFLVTAPTEVTYPSKERRQVAVLLADQVAAALDAE